MRLNLDDLRLRAGQRYECSFSADIAPIVAGGSKFDVIVAEAANVTVERITGGYLLDLDLTAKICGPCSRCLKQVCDEVCARQQEFIPSVAGGWSDSNDELSPFVDDLVVDLAGLGREAVALAMPDRMLCAPDCKGLCSLCGADLNEGACSCRPLEV